MMKNTFTVSKKDLSQILASMQPICTKRTTLDTTNSILFHVGHKEMVLKGTDLEVSLQASSILASSTLDDSISFLVPGRRIFDIIKAFDGDITCSISHNQLTIASGDVDVALNVQDPEHFPPFPEQIENLMHISKADFVAMLESVAFIIPQNNSNPALNGLYLEITSEIMKMTATDGHCLAQVASPHYTLSESKQWLIPRRAIFELKKMLDTCNDETIFLGVCGSQLVISGELFNFFTKLLADPFPEYAPILEKTTFSPASIDRSSFIKTLRRASCLLSGHFLATQFRFHDEQLHVAMRNKEVGTLEESLALTGIGDQDMTLRFYAPYLLQGLQAFHDDEVTFFLKNNSKPIIFESTKQHMSKTYVVMPVSPTT
jgi:DNA polymerase-3 subunit beta